MRILTLFHNSCSDSGIFTPYKQALPNVRNQTKRFREAADAEAPPNVYPFATGQPSVQSKIAFRRSTQIARAGGHYDDGNLAIKLAGIVQLMHDRTR